MLLKFVAKTDLCEVKVKWKKMTKMCEINFFGVEMKNENQIYIFFRFNLKNCFETQNYFFSFSPAQKKHRIWRIDFWPHSHPLAVGGRSSRVVYGAARERK